MDQPNPTAPASSPEIPDNSTGPAESEPTTDPNAIRQATPAELAQPRNPDQHHPFPEAGPSRQAKDRAAAGNGYYLNIQQSRGMTRSQRARFASAIIEDLCRLTKEDPAFDLPRQYLNEARQVMPTKAE